MFEFSEGTTVEGLFEFYGIPVSREYNAIIGNKVTKPNDLLAAGDVVCIFQSVYGG